MIELGDIKGFVEHYFKVEDIGIKDGRNKLPFLRYLYFKLATELTSNKLESIGLTVNKSHPMVLHGLKIFDEQYDQPHFRPYKKGYLNILGRINMYIIKPNDLSKINNLTEIYDLSFHQINEFEQIARQFLESQEKQEDVIFIKNIC